MLIGYERTPISSISLNGTLHTAAFVNGYSALTDDSVAYPALVHMTAATVDPDNPNRLIMTINFPSSKIRVFGFLGLNVPTGTWIQYSFTSNGTGHTGTIKAVTLPDGSVAAFAVMPQTYDNVTLLQLTIKDFLGAGVSYFTTDFYIKIGELWISDANEYPIKQPGVVSSILNDSAVRRSTNGQPFPLLRRDYRSLSVDLVPKPYSVVYEPQSPNTSIAQRSTPGKGWDNLRGALAKARTCLVIPKYKDNTQTIDNLIATQNAIFGWCSNRGEIRHIEADLYGLQLKFDEYPASTM